MKTDVNLHSKSNKQKNLEKKNYFFGGISSATDEKSSIRPRKSGDRIRGSGSVGQVIGSADPDPHENVSDPQRWNRTVTSLCLEVVIYCIGIHKGAWAERKVCCFWLKRTH